MVDAERIARNDAIFRGANEGISDAAEAAAVEEPVPLVCECADPSCREIVRTTLHEYREIREEPRTFLNVPGHQAAAQGWAQVVERHDRYVVLARRSVPQARWPSSSKEVRIPRRPSSTVTRDTNAGPS